MGYLKDSCVYGFCDIGAFFFSTNDPKRIEGCCILLLLEHYIFHRYLWENDIFHQIIIVLADDSEAPKKHTSHPSLPNVATKKHKLHITTVETCRWKTPKSGDHYKHILSILLLMPNRDTYVRWNNCVNFVDSDLFSSHTVQFELPATKFCCTFFFRVARCSLSITLRWHFQWLVVVVVYVCVLTDNTSRNNLNTWFLSLAEKTTANIVNSTIFQCRCYCYMRFTVYVLAWCVCVCVFRVRARF